MPIVSGSNNSSFSRVYNDGSFCYEDGSGLVTWFTECGFHFCTFRKYRNETSVSIEILAKGIFRRFSKKTFREI
ncbi:hypothetical protein ACFLY7_00625 [Patescibacteria group bacterium]